MKTKIDVSANTALTYLYCYNNQLPSLDVSGATALAHLDCSSNHLTRLPKLPDSLRVLYCSNNPFEEPISQDIIKKFNLNESKLYTEERVKVFKSYEWQKSFLMKYPERYNDIHLWVLLRIKDEVYKTNLNKAEQIRASVPTIGVMEAIDQLVELCTELLEEKEHLKQSGMPFAEVMWNFKKNKRRSF